MAGRRSFGQVYLKGSTYYIRTRNHGVTRIQKVGPDKAVAEDLLADIRSKRAREEALGIRFVASASLAEVWKAVEAARRGHLAPRWFRYHRRQIEVAAAYFGERPVKDLAPHDIEDFLAHLKDRGCKPATARRYLASLSPVLGEAVKRGFARENVAARVKRPRLVEPEIPFLGEPDIRRLVAAAPRDLKPFIVVLADTGLRRGELLDLEWRDVDIARGTVLVRHSKTGRGREVPLTARARGVFESRHGGAGGERGRGGGGGGDGRDRGERVEVGAASGPFSFGRTEWRGTSAAGSGPRFTACSTGAPRQAASVNPLRPRADQEGQQQHAVHEHVGGEPHSQTTETMAISDIDPNIAQPQEINACYRNKEDGDTD